MACGVTGRVLSQYAQLSAVGELGSKTCSVRCSIRRHGAVVAAEVLRRVDVQYRLGVRLLDVAPVTGMVIHNTLSISHH